MQRPNGSRRETNPLPTKNVNAKNHNKVHRLPVTMFDFRVSCFIFPSSCFLFNASHRRAVYGGLCDSSYLFLWMIYVPSILLACNCLRMNSRKGTRHCSFRSARLRVSHHVLCTFTMRVAVINSIAYRRRCASTKWATWSWWMNL